MAEEKQTPEQKEQETLMAAMVEVLVFRQFQKT